MEQPTWGTLEHSGHCGGGRYRPQHCPGAMVPLASPGGQQPAGGHSVGPGVSPTVKPSWAPTLAAQGTGPRGAPAPRLPCVHTPALGKSRPSHCSSQDLAVCFTPEPPRGKRPQHFISTCSRCCLWCLAAPQALPAPYGGLQGRPLAWRGGEEDTAQADHTAAAGPSPAGSGPSHAP